jgi:hypothetical protein
MVGPIAFQMTEAAVPTMLFAEILRLTDLFWG